MYFKFKYFTFISFNGWLSLIFFEWVLYRAQVRNIMLLKCNKYKCDFMWSRLTCTSSISLCFSSLSVSSFCCKLRAFISSMACFFSRSLSCERILIYVKPSQLKGHPHWLSSHHNNDSCKHYCWHLYQSYLMNDRNTDIQSKSIDAVLIT